MYKSKFSIIAREVELSEDCTGTAGDVVTYLTYVQVLDVGRGIGEIVGTNKGVVNLLLCSEAFLFGLAFRS